MTYQPPPTRRTFLKDGAAAGAAFTIVPRHVLGGPGQVAPSDKVNIALVGAGGQGRTNLRPLFDQPDAQVIAVADPAEYFDLERFYFRGMAGRKPVRAMIEQHYAQATPNFRCCSSSSPDSPCARNRWPKRWETESVPSMYVISRSGFRSFQSLRPMRR